MAQLIGHFSSHTLPLLIEAGHLSALGDASGSPCIPQVPSWYSRYVSTGRIDRNREVPNWRAFRQGPSVLSRLGAGPIPAVSTTHSVQAALRGSGNTMPVPPVLPLRCTASIGCRLRAFRSSIFIDRRAISLVVSSALGQACASNSHALRTSGSPFKMGLRVQN